MICRVNVPRRVKVSVPAVYEIFWANGNVETVESTAPLDYTDYPDAASILGSNGTIDASGMSTPVFIGGSNVSLIGGIGADTLFYAGGNVTVNYSANDYLAMQNGVIPGNFSSADGDTDFQMLYFDGSSAGALKLNGATDGITAYKKYNNTNSKNATAVTLNAQYGDFGVQLDENGNPAFDLTPRQNAEYFKISCITALVADSTVIGNAKFNEIYINGGGYYNFIVGQIAAKSGDSIYFVGGGGLIADFGIDAQKNGAGTTYASLVTASAYDRFDADTYYNGGEQLCLKGNVTGFYIPMATNSNSKKAATMTAIITYTDLNDDTQVIVLPHIKKGVNTTSSSTPSRRVFDTNSLALNSFKIFHGADSYSSLSSTAIGNLKQDITNFPAELQPRAAELYRRYKNSPFYSPPETHSGQGSTLETLPAWLTAEEATP